MKPRRISLKEKAYTSIKADISSCRYSPGAVLSEMELVERLGISRTPIREALNRLEQEGLVKIVPQRGVFVADITLKTVLELYQVREVLEPFIIRLATPLIPEERLAEFRSAFAGMTGGAATEEIIALDHRFHFFLAESCGNAFLAQLMANIRTHIDRTRIAASHDPESVRLGVREHLAIIDAMLERDAEKAAGAMYSHLSRSRQVAF